MKRLLIFLLLASLQSVAAKQSDYHSGKLLDVQIGTSLYGSVSRDDKFDLTIDDGTTSYVARYVQFSAWSYTPNDLEIGKELQFRVSGNHVFVLRPNGKEVKATILKRASSR